ncbi:TetR family transcriptional regulator [Xanthomonas phaseoli pv. phaseoli]|uniref:Transcriptional regulator n=4 Tax=Xanthomonas TaxID=338 RepID=A0AB38DZE0_XANCH|nr:MULTISPECIES: TetR/AcrR family transcriptional regulator [Xanthomonas]ATS20487.1 TetR/AcrR family transcriptional regulator [Xanthomonas phaseoli pv. phaseoli]ATS27135.1 TetR/AcrR family transcriptional regulator [Xanthomonas phaseoli pv. phaseoli]ATS35398.1 TetR/AcrR family transcriptional regulator [Xanthomonas phaseoli pv. phaseoli]AZU12238.1 TetR family transcriptional regulator [Xanthomonas phaseoli pv. phaseoli]AZU24997.1 TetR family transcriptional regulator [Xanthomonas phaseoli pv.
MTTEISRARGRPRAFDAEQAVATAQQLFHARGYDALSVADLTAALGINPPSFYAAFGSKAGLYARILDRYAQTGAIPLPQLLDADRPLADALADVLEHAARCYVADPAATGCLVLEGTRSNDAQAREAACGFHVAAQELIRTHIAQQRPEDADRLADFVSTTMAGLSASARHGQSLERLLASARLAGEGIRAALRG